MNQLKNILIRIINIGIDRNIQPDEALKVRTVNIYSLVILLCTVVNFFASKGYHQSFILQSSSYITVLICLIYYLLNYYQKFTWCYIILVLCNNILVLYSAFAIDKHIGVHFMFIFNIAISTLLFSPSSKLYIFSVLLTMLMLFLLEFFDYQIAYIPKQSLDEIKVEEARIFVQSLLFFGILIILTVFSYNLHKIAVDNRELLNQSISSNKALAQQKSELHSVNRKLISNQKELEETHQQLRETQGSKITDLNHALNQHVQAINKVTMITEIHVDGTIIDINPKCQSSLHFTKEELMGKKWENFIVHTDATSSNILEQVIQGETVELELCHTTKLGTTFWTNSTLMPFYRADGTIEKFLEISFSIDRIVRQQKELQKSQESLSFYDRSLTKFSQIMRWSRGESTSEWANELLSNLIEHSSALQGAIYQFDPKSQILKLLCVHAYDKSQGLQDELQLGEGIIGEVARSQKTVHIQHQENEVTIHVLDKVLNIRSLLVMPLLLNDEIVAVLVMTSLNDFPDEVVKFLHKISTNIATTLFSMTNSFYIRRLLEESNVKNQELQTREEELRQNLEELEITSERMKEAEQKLTIQAQKLQSMNEGLEQRVYNRTKELEVSKKKMENLLIETQTKNDRLVAKEQELKQNTEELQAINENLKSTQQQLQKSLQHESETRKKVQEANTKIKKAQTQLVQAEKMASLGQLVAGIAHEINNPINFVYAGTQSLYTILEDFSEIIDQYEQLGEGTQTMDVFQEKWQELTELKEELEFEDMQEDLFNLLADIQSGAERTAEIVKGLRIFSRLDESEAKITSIHDNINATLTILNSKYKGRIEIDKKYDPSLPDIECLSGQINQVFMNILSNAIQAIPQKGKITIETKHISADNTVKISITDNGTGMSPEVQARIFDPFFTTKDVGEGTGMGLAISHGIIEKHGGKIQLDSIPKRGTTFVIILPVQAEIKTDLG